MFSLPLTFSQIEESFSKDGSIPVNYKESKIKGNDFVTYLFNINLNLVVDNGNLEYADKEILLTSYINKQQIKLLDQFNDTLFHVIFAHKGIDIIPELSFMSSEEAKLFSERNTTLIKNIIDFLDSCPRYIFNSLKTKDICCSKENFSEESSWTPPLSVLSVWKSDLLPFYYSSFSEKSVYFQYFSGENVGPRLPPLMEIMKTENNFVMHFFASLIRGTLGSYNKSDITV